MKDFAIDGYEYFVRSTTDGRGVVIYYKDFLTVQYVNVLNNFKFDKFYHRSRHIVANRC